MKLKFKNIIIFLILFMLLILGICFLNYKSNIVSNKESKLCKEHESYINGKVDNNKLILNNIVFCKDKRLYKYKSIKLTLYYKKDNSIEEVDFKTSSSVTELGTFISNLELNKGDYSLNDLYIELNLVGMDERTQILDVLVVEV